MKIQKISAYTYTSQKFGNYVDSYDYDFGTANNQLAFKDAIATSASVSVFLLIGGFILNKGMELFEHIVKNNKCVHINKLIWVKKLLNE